MKKAIYIILATCLLVSSCELERLPKNGYTPDVVMQDPAAVSNMLIGCYDQLRAMSDNAHRFGEYPGDNILKDKSSTDSFMQFINYMHNPNNANRTRDLWNQCYKIIAQGQEIMNMVDETTATAAEKQQLGETYYLRGVSFFYLVRIFGRPYYQNPDTSPGVPIVLGAPENILSDGLSLPDRATVKQVYDQIIADLVKAESLMTENKSGIWATREAAQAMLSRVYLYMSGTYENPNIQYADKAIEYADKVIASNRYRMLSRAEFVNYNTMLPENNPETIFAVKRTPSDASTTYGSNIGSLYTRVNTSGYNEIYASSKYMDRLRHSGNDHVNVVGPNAADVRGTFIRPFYTVKTVNGVASHSNTDTANPNYAPGVPPANGDVVFRVIVDSYNASGLVNFVYMQLPVTGSPGSYVAAQGSTQYPLTALENGRYSFQYTPENGPGVVTYVGDVDKHMEMNQGQPKFSVFKTSMEGSPTNSNLHSPIISRLAEIYLNLAEAYVKKGDYESALTNINVVRNRAVLNNPVTIEQITAHGDDVVDNERALELGWEAHRGFDAFRVGRSLERRYPGFMGSDTQGENNLKSIPADHSAAVQVIQQGVITTYATYGKLTQNPITDLPAPDKTPYTQFIPY